MTIAEYVRENFNKLEKSRFNDDEIVLVQTFRNDDIGWGHHSFEGVGIDSEGNTVWAFSSGCSCQGSCSVEHSHTCTVKLLDADGKEFGTDEDGFDPAKFTFPLAVEFRDYD